MEAALLPRGKGRAGARGWQPCCSGAVESEVAGAARRMAARDGQCPRCSEQPEVQEGGHRHLNSVSLTSVRCSNQSHFAAGVSLRTRSRSSVCWLRSFAETRLSVDLRGTSFPSTLYPEFRGLRCKAAPL